MAKRIFTKFVIQIRAFSGLITQVEMIFSAEYKRDNVVTFQPLILPRSEDIMIYSAINFVTVIKGTDTYT